MSKAAQPAEWEDGYIHLDTFEQAVRKNWHRLKRCGLVTCLRPGMSVLDLCCGRGSTLSPLVSFGARVVGLDLSHSLLRLARQNGVEALVLADSSVLPFRSDSFDAVVVQGGLHHLWFDQFERTLSEIDRVLKPRGLFAFTEPANTLALRLYVALVDSPLASLISYTRNWRKTLEHERGTYFHWLRAQDRAIALIRSRMDALRMERGVVTMFGLARSRKSAGGEGNE